MSGFDSACLKSGRRRASEVGTGFDSLYLAQKLIRQRFSLDQEKPAEKNTVEGLSASLQ